MYRIAQPVRRGSGYLPDAVAASVQRAAPVAVGAVS